MIFNILQMSTKKNLAIVFAMLFHTFLLNQAFKYRRNYKQHKLINQKEIQIITNFESCRKKDLVKVNIKEEYFFDFLFNRKYRAKN